MHQSTYYMETLCHIAKTRSESNLNPILQPKSKVQNPSNVLIHWALLKQFYGLYEQFDATNGSHEVHNVAGEEVHNKPLIVCSGM